MKKILLVILDGAGDGLKKGTSLEVAHKPVLDEFTRDGVGGLINNELGDHPDSGISTFQLLGYPLENYPGRGYLDAMGIGITARPNTLYMRANFATVEKKTKKTAEGQYAPKYIVIDRRAGRDETGLSDLSKSIKEMLIEGFKVEFHKSVAHRGVLTISSPYASPNISDTDSGNLGDEIRQLEATKPDDKSKRTAAVLNKWLHETEKILEANPINKNRKFPANYVLLRGASTYRIEKSFKERFGLKGAVIAKSPVVRGLGKHFEMDLINVPGATADMKTDMKAKTLAALEALRDHDFVILHILAPDIAGHDRIVRIKAGIIEKIDREVFSRIKEYVDFSKTVLCVTSDHITSIFSGDHEPGKFPFMIFTDGIEANKVSGYYEMECKKGPVIEVYEWMEEIMNYI